MQCKGNDMKSYSFFTFSISLILLILLFTSCNTTEPTPFKEELPKSIKLKLLDVSCTEAFINVNVGDSVLPIAITFKKDNAALFSFTLTKTDTIIIDTTLQPNITYTYQITAQISGKEENSDTLQVKTLQTTSNNFVWQTFEFGGNISNSVLFDVAIIDENNIWAVGEIRTDSTDTLYNVVHWDGAVWKLLKLQFYSFCGQPNTGSYPARAIFTFNDGVFVLGSTSQIIYLSDGNQLKIECLPLTISINKIWGSASTDFYATGNTGSLAHHQNADWSKIETGTTIPLNDIYGSKDGKNVLISGYDSETGNSLLLRYSDNTMTKIYEVLPGSPGWNEARDNLISGVISSLWTISEYQLWIASTFGFYMAPQKTEGEAKLKYKFSFPIGFIERIRGEGNNNVYAVGDYSTIFHYDGLDWTLCSINFGDGAKLYSVAAKNNTIVAVGTTGKAILMLGKQLN